MKDTLRSILSTAHRKSSSYVLIYGLQASDRICNFLDDSKSLLWASIILLDIKINCFYNFYFFPTTLDCNTVSLALRLLLCLCIPKLYWSSTIVVTTIANEKTYNISRIQYVSDTIQSILCILTHLILASVLWSLICKWGN